MESLDQHVNLVNVFYKSAFCYFDICKFSRYSVFTGNLVNGVWQVVVEEVFTRQINGYRNHFPSGPCAAAITFACLLEHVEIHFVYLARLFKYWNKPGGRYYTALRIYPSHQYLAVTDCFSHSADNWLIINLNPSIFQGFIKIPDNIIFK